MKFCSNDLEKVFPQPFSYNFTTPSAYFSSEKYRAHNKKKNCTELLGEFYKFYFHKKYFLNFGIFDVRFYYFIFSVKLCAFEEKM